MGVRGAISQNQLIEILQDAPQIEAFRIPDQVQWPDILGLDFDVVVNCV